MKNFILVALTALALFVTPVIAQDNTSTDYSNTAYLGGMYESSLHGFMGTGQKITGGLWMFESALFGKDQSLGIDAVYFVKPSVLIPQIPEKLILGLVAGPNSDWVNTIGDGQPAVMYLTGSSGLVVSYEIANNFGVWGHGKYVFELQETESYSNKWRFAIGVNFGY